MSFPASKKNPLDEALLQRSPDENQQLAQCPSSIRRKLQKALGSEALSLLGLPVVLDPLQGLQALKVNKIHL